MEVKMVAGLDHMDSALLDPSLLDGTGGRGVNGAATTVQKVYRSYRTRRKLADSAVVVEELWWVRVYPRMLRLSSWLSSTGSRLLIQDIDMVTTCISTIMFGARPKLASRSSTGLILVREKM